MNRAIDDDGRGIDPQRTVLKAAERDCSAGTPTESEITFF